MLDALEVLPVTAGIAAALFAPARFASLRPRAARALAARGDAGGRRGERAPLPRAGRPVNLAPVAAGRQAFAPIYRHGAIRFRYPAVMPLAGLRARPYTVRIMNGILVHRPGVGLPAAPFARAAGGPRAGSAR